MTRFSDAKGRKVVSVSSAGTVGQISDFVVEPKGSHVLALHLRKTEGKVDTLLWTDVHAFGEDAVTVESADKVTEAPNDVDELSGKDHKVLNKRVLSVAGDDLGEVADVEFDDGTGVIDGLVLGNDDTVTRCTIVGVGSYAVVVELAEPASSS